ncbi:MAG: hypothetical protein EA412_06045 [Chitinophagaceae bacterium]|nr:MAG: hypothetical protein EA412_06045 [Chitinophagaceae bacterium]
MFRKLTKAMKNLKIFILTCVVMLTVLATAQAGPPGPEPNPIPLDGGIITILIAIAGAIGGKKVFNKFKKKQQQ